jgi:hypothetical protein
MALQKNTRYNDSFVEAQSNVQVTDPKGYPYMIFTGMQFKYCFYEDVEEGCGCGGTAKEWVRYYLINAKAVCEPGEFLWPAGDAGQTIRVSGKFFVETDTLKYPPVDRHIEDELSGKDTDLFTPPWQRSIPRKGGVWYTDPWQSKKGS